MIVFIRFSLSILLFINAGLVYSQINLDWKSKGRYFESLIQKHLYEENYEISLKYLDSTITLYKSNDLKLYYITIQNKAFVLEEKFLNFNQAILLADSAYDYWTSVGDFNNKANISKYLGYVFSCMGEFKLSKQYIDTAYYYFKLVGNENGVLVTKFDEALLYFNMKDFNKSLNLLNEVKSLWLSEEDYQRVFFTNIKIIQNYQICKPKNSDEICHLLQENKALLESKRAINNNEFSKLLSEIDGKYGCVTAK
jgi:tetratricopeptide (TPR) repeat protein